MISLILTIALLGVILAVITYVPMPQAFKNIIVVIAVLILILYLIQVFGFVDIPIPHRR